MKLWTAWHDRAAELGEERDGGPMAAALAKLARLAVRLALIHQLVTAAHAGPAALCAQLDDTPHIGADAMRAAVKLCDWFHNEAERVYASLAESPEDADARRLADLIRRKGKDGRMTPRELMTSNRRKYRSTQLAEETLNELARAEYGDWQTSNPGAKGGRPSRVFVLRVTEPDAEQ